MRVLAIGDIHGCFTALKTLEQAVPFAAEDLLVTLGDYIDRGPDSRGVLKWLIQREAKFKLVPLTGNHELMMCAAAESSSHYEDWIRYGGDAVLRSYGTKSQSATIDQVPPAHWQFLRKTCRPYFETKTHFFVHANACPDIALENQPDYMLYWEKFNDPPPHESGKIMVCGHTPQKDGRPRSIGHAVCIDTRTYGGGWLTCLDVTTQKYWQANEQGETRVDFLETVDR